MQGRRAGCWLCNSLQAAPSWLALATISCIHTGNAIADGGGPPSGDVTPVHDPSGVVIDSGFGFVFSTSYGDEGGVEVRRTAAPVSSVNISSAVWLEHSVVFSIARLPQWLHERHLGPALWAPDVSFHSPTREWRLYYAASSFGSQRSCIGLAVTMSLLRPEWIDRGPVLCSDICSPVGRPSPHACNAIDPHPIMAESEAYITFGSFWTGIKMTRLDARTGLLPESSGSSPQQHLAAPLWDVAENFQPDPPRPIEASWLEYDPTSGWYWLFTNWGMCCRGVNSTYNIRVGRSRNVTGPFLDQVGKPMEKGGGTLLLGTQNEYIGPGQLGLARVGAGGIPTDGNADGDGSFAGWIASMHYYNGTDAGKPYLRLMNMTSKDGWPILSEML
jgi:arabinan endo-1,5-alpha-L-arabinosidase